MRLRIFGRPSELGGLRGAEGVVSLLLEKGAAVDAKNREGWTALMAAIEPGDTEVVRLLLDKGADANAANSIDLRESDAATALIWP